MSAMIVRAPAASSCSPRSASAWLPPTKPIAVMPAATAAVTPAGESSTTMQSAGATPHPAAPHAGTGRAPACRVGRRSPRTGSARRTGSGRWFRGSPGCGRSARTTRRISARAARSARARHAAWRAVRREALSVAAATRRGEVSRQLAAGRRLDRRRTCRPAAGRRNSARPSRASARMPTRANSSAATAVAIGSLSTSTPLQSKMITGAPRRPGPPLHAA